MRGALCNFEKKNKMTPQEKITLRRQKVYFNSEKKIERDIAKIDPTFHLSCLGF